MSPNRVQKNISRLMALLLCVLLLLSNVPAVHAEGGNCGSSLQWSFDGTTLTITGSDAMTDFTNSNLPPWYEFREQILRISLPEGLTRIGDMAFYDCTNLQSVILPSALQAIGDAAFYNNANMTMLTMNEGLRSVGEKAFLGCSALADLRLPSTLVTIDNEAFAMCSSLSCVMIPQSVNSVGYGVFSYCSNLVRVDIESNVEMPTWSCYGCNKLELVTVCGVTINAEDLKVPNLPEGSYSIGSSEQIDSSAEKVTVVASDSDATIIESVTEITSNEMVVQNTTVTKTDNSTTVTSTTTTNGQLNQSTTEITSTVQNDEGWKDVVDKMNSATIGGNANHVDVTVYLPNSDTVSSEVLEEFAGKDVNLTVQTQSGSKITLDGKKLEDVKGDLVLGYTLIPAENVPEELLGCTVYHLNFHSDAAVPSEMIIRLPGGHAYGTATLYQLKKEKLEQLQSVMVDGNGDSHWYLGSVDDKTDYLIGIDVPGAVEDSPIIPAELHDVYKVENVYDGVEYVVTGRSSSWGMELGQVMSILAVVMVSVIAVVGVVMFIWNKRRLKAGYVPDWDDDDE